MTMAMRSFIAAAAIAALLGVAGAGWWLTTQLDGEAPQNDGRTAFSDGYDDREGSLYDEFGGTGAVSDDRVTITAGGDLFSDDVFDFGADERRRVGDGASRLSAGPRFDWSGSGDGLQNSEPLPRNTAADRVEADCRARGGGSYACRCLVRLARRDLSEAEFEFLSLAEEREPRGERLSRSGLEITALGDLSAALLTLNAASSRRCGAGLTP